MRKQFVSTLVFCAACLALGTQAQSSSDPSSSPGSSPGSQYGNPSGAQSSSEGRHHYGATGLMGQEIRASQLTGSQVTGSSGQALGTISDIILNAGSGRVDFAIVSLTDTGSTGGSSSPGGTSSSSSSTATPGSSSSSPSSSPTSSIGGSSSPGSSSTGSSASTTSAGGKQIAVPWALLRASSSGATAGQAPSFAFLGDTTKLQSAPSFDPGTDLSQPGWRHSIFSYFGMSGAGTATGGSQSPGSEGSSSGSSSKPPGSSGNQ